MMKRRGRDGEREGRRDRWTDRQTDRDTHRQRDGDTYAQSVFRLEIYGFPFGSRQ